MLIDLPPLPARVKKREKRGPKKPPLPKRVVTTQEEAAKKVQTQKAAARVARGILETKANAKAIETIHPNQKHFSIVDSDIVEHGTSELVQNALHNKKIIWQPFPGVQTHFLESDEDEVLFAGGRGSGKSMCLIVDPLRYVNNKNFRALVIRRTMPELRELIGRAKEIYYAAFPGGVRWKEQEKMFTFSTGATIEFGYCDTIDDAERYRGQQYTWLGVDELTQYADPSIISKLKASLRTTDPTLKIYCRYTTNPTGRGRNWVKDYFIDKAPSGVRYTEEETIQLRDKKISLKTTRKWFNSTVEDNPAILENNPQYLAILSSLPSDALRKAWLDGDWDAIEGMAFPDFDQKIHVLPKDKVFKIPRNWLKFRGCDWGYSSMAVCLWLAEDYDGNIFVYRELAANGPVNRNDVRPRLTADTFAQKVMEMEAGENVRYGVLDMSTWAQRGDSGPSIAEEMEMQGCFWRQSDRSSGSRKAAKVLMHKLLKLDEYTQKPKIYIFPNCVQLIRCLSSLSVDENDPEDVDTDGFDHPWDALMYAIMSRPHPFGGNDTDPFNPLGDRPVVFNSTFGF